MEKSMNASERERALECLGEICCNGEAKDSDRIAAAKLLLEYGGGGRGEAENALVVRMEGIAEEYLR